MVVIACIKLQAMEYKLIEEIINLSNSDNWDTAKEEWLFHHAYYHSSGLTCLCGHRPIKNICVLKNRLNKTEAEVGNCCVTKFLGIEDGTIVFSAISRLKKDLSKSLGKEAFEFIKSKSILNEFECAFYLDTIGKRILSDKQMAIRQRINTKFLNFTSSEGSIDQIKIESILIWAKSKADFQTDFVISVKSSFERNGKLSDKQIQAIDNIIARFGIKIDS